MSNKTQISDKEMESVAGGTGNHNLSKTHTDMQVTIQRAKESLARGESVNSSLDAINATSVEIAEIKNPQEHHGGK